MSGRRARARTACACVRALAANALKVALARFGKLLLQRGRHHTVRCLLLLQLVCERCAVGLGVGQVGFQALYGGL